VAPCCLRTLQRQLGMCALTQVNPTWRPADPISLQATPVLSLARMRQAAAKAQVPLEVCRLSRRRFIGDACDRHQASQGGRTRNPGMKPLAWIADRTQPAAYRRRS
jgi:hypothetical protein